MSKELARLVDSIADLATCVSSHVDKKNERIAELEAALAAERQRVADLERVVANQAREIVLLARKAYPPLDQNESELAELRKDRERLDKLERLHDYPKARGLYLWPSYGEDGVTKVWAFFENGDETERRTLREAIDGVEEPQG